MIVGVHPGSHCATAPAFSVNGRSGPGGRRHHGIRCVGERTPLREAEEDHVGQVNFRMKDERLSLIDRAAAIRGVTRTEFVLRSSEAAAIETLAERPIIALDDEAYDAFVAALDAPVAPNDRLKRQSARRPLWER